MFEPILVSSRDPSPEGRFTGFLFSGSDLVLGAEGLAAFGAATGRQAVSGEDGCYAFMRRDGDRLVFGNDYCGHGKLFLYARGAEWAVSTSFAALVDHLRANGLPAGFRAYHRDLSLADGSILAQLPSHRTALDEIRLCPRGTEIVVQGGRPSLVPAPAAGESTDGAAYRDLLDIALSVWAGRLRTLHGAGLRPSVALSGGMDSRAVAAFHIQAARRDGLAAEYRSSTAPRHGTDLAVAEKIAAKFGLALNVPAPRWRVRDGQASFDLWRATSLGNYYPVRLPEEFSTAGAVSFGGGGGEMHRDFYAFEDLAALRAYLKRKFVTPGAAAACFADILESVRSFGPAGAEAGIGAIRYHYAEFRSRLHAGTVPNQKLHVIPLASRHFAAAGAAQSDAMIRRGQMLYDVMASLAPRLLALPFDDPAKAPGPEVTEALTQLRVRPREGRVWGALPGPAAEGGPEAAEVLEAEVRRAAGEVRGLLPARVFTEAEAQLALMIGSAREKVGESRMIHQIMLFDALREVVPDGLAPSAVEAQAAQLNTLRAEGRRLVAGLRERVGRLLRG